MIRRLRAVTPAKASIPRESGDDPDPVMAYDALHEYSPRERG